MALDTKPNLKDDIQDQLNKNQYPNSPMDPSGDQDDILSAILNKQQLYDYSQSPNDNLSQGSPLSLDLGGNDQSSLSPMAPLPKLADEEDDDNTPAPKAKVTADPITLTKQYKDSNLIPFNDVQDLASMQKDARQQAAMVSALEGLTDAGKSIATGGYVKADPTKYDDLRALAAQPIKDREALLKDQEDKAKRDPNSDLSKIQRQTVTDMLNSMGRRQLADSIMAKGLSAKQLEDAFGQVGLTSMLTHHEAAETRKAMAEQNRLLKESMLKEKTTKTQDDYSNKLTQAAMTSRGQPDVSRALQDVYAIKKANILANRYPDPNKMSNQEVNLLVSELGKVATGGVPNHSELQGLTPDTLKTKFGSAVSKLIGNPTPANAGNFVKMYQDYLNEMGQPAKQLLDEKYGRLFPTEGKAKENAIRKMGQDNYDQAIAAFMPHKSKLVMPNATPATTSSDDAEAISWAQQNKSDPRAQQILKLHGML